MADVYRARDFLLGKIVVVKILKEENCEEDSVRARFLEEARMAARFDHENIINVFDFGEHENRPFMVMEFLRGEELGTAIQQGRAGNTADRLKIALQAARALEEIHAHDIVHRDIKPANIHVGSTGVAKLIDFGIAKAPDASVKTQTGFAVGTLYYMAPEQVLGKSGKLVDIYAFGLVLFELMCGRRALAQDSMERTFYKILHEPVDLEPLKAAGVPAGIVDLVRRCTLKAPEQRIQSFTAICEELERLRVEYPIPENSALPKTATYPALAQPPKRKSGRKLIYAGAGAAALLVVLGSVWILTRHGAPAPPPVKATPPPVSQTSAAALKAGSLLANRAGDMVFVPGGVFLSGENKTRKEVSAFYIDKTEVTNRAYSLFAKDRGLPPPKGKPEMPVTNVTMEQAQNFCKWADKSLPSWDQWEKAARGTDGFQYPWGNEPDTVRANVSDNPTLKTRKALLAADSMQGSASPYGAVNMAGNAWEYVEGTHPPINKQSIADFKEALKPPCSIKGEWVNIRGGSYKRPLSDAVSEEFRELPACYHAEDYGFRCVRQP